MKNAIGCISMILATAACCCPVKEYTNPLNIKLGDPYVLLASDGNYYMYGTGAVTDGFGCYKSEDLTCWEFMGSVYHGNTSTSWTCGSFWAPEVYEIDGKFYMFFSADWKENPENELENFRIGVAVSDSPSGPFCEISTGPLFDPGYPVIDANVFKDDDGRYYLYFSRCCYKHPVESEFSQWAREQGLFDEVEESWVYGVELLPDFSGIVGEPVLILRPPSNVDDPQKEWESISVTSGEINRRWTEGSFTIKHNGKYYIMYSANFYAGENYAVGYAVADFPLGPYTKSADNPILKKTMVNGNLITGMGHNSVFPSKDGKHLYCAYHGRTEKTGMERVVFIDKIKFKKDRLKVFGPTIGKNAGSMGNCK